jgi:hypothetical protein
MQVLGLVNAQTVVSSEWFHIEWMHVQVEQFKLQSLVRCIRQNPYLCNKVNKKIRLQLPQDQ